MIPFVIKPKILNLFLFNVLEYNKFLLNIRKNLSNHRFLCTISYKMTIIFNND